jgi:hypothetical protein
MTDKVLQCCYTNVSRETDGRTRSGWKAVAVSPDIPPEAYRFCTSMQIADSSIRSDLTDEHGEVLNLLEISGDGDYLYMTRTQYGLLDRLGRANMFSHCFLFPLKAEGALTDPNVFLTVDNRNFRDNEAEAAAPVDDLMRLPPFDLSGALTTAGLSGEGYIRLIQCVYAQVSEKQATRPLYIQYDGTDLQLRALLYCIYCGVPFSTRRKLCSAAPAAGAVGGKNLVFSEYAREHPFHIIPQTGENDVLTPRMERKIQRYGYVDYAARNPEKSDAYFADLEKNAVLLGDPDAAGDLILKIAYQMMPAPDRPETLDDGELDSRLSDALRSGYRNSPVMERYIAGMLDAVTGRKLLLTEESEANLEEKLRAPVTRELADAGDRYHIYRFSTLAPEEAAQRLGEMSPALFRIYSRRLAADRRGAEILDCYYSGIRLPEEAGWSDLKIVWRESDFVPVRQKTLDRVSELAWNLYRNELKEDAISACRRYLEVMKLVLPQDRLEECAVSAKEEYWEQVDFASLSVKRAEEYRAFQLPEHSVSRLANGFCALVGAFRRPDDFLQSVNCFFQTDGREIAREERIQLCQKLFESVGRPGTDDAEYLKWLTLAALSDREPFDAMLAVREDIQNGVFDSFEDDYQRLSVQCGDADKEFRTANRILAGTCLKQDRADRSIPLDIWLTLGAGGYSNAFEIFDSFKPSFLDPEAEVDLRASHLFSRGRFQSDAAEYIRDRGEEYRAVKRWVNAYRQSIRARRAELRHGESSGGLLELGRGLFTKRESDSAGNDSAGKTPETEDDTPDGPSREKHRGFFGRNR